MVYAGAKGDTATEMEKALHFDALKERTHPAFNAIDQSLTSAPASAEGSFRLSIANAAWGDKTQHFESGYLDTLATNYGSGVNLADFKGNPEGARQTINTWVLDQTEQRIKDLMPPGSVDPSTRLVLANAIYFKADWAQKFSKESTSKGPFTLSSGTKADADFMHQHSSFPYANVDGVEALELPYVGNRVSMVIFAPPAGSFAQFQSGLDARRAGALIDALKVSQMALSMPKFSFSTTTPMADALGALGIRSVFSLNSADLSGIDGQRDLFVSGVFHKAFVAVDEKGTEAAAATAIGLAGASLAPLTVSIDRPFIFLIRDKETGAVLFIGRVVDPTK